MAQTDVAIRPLIDGESAACERILRSLPEWFGIESATRQYVSDCQTLPTWLALRGDEATGFITLRRHFPASAEIHCIAVAAGGHRGGIGRRLVDFVEQLLQSDGVRYLQVKTLGPSRQCEQYDRTRAFYRALGYEPLEEFPTLWPGNPCLLMVKRLAAP